MTRSKSLRVMPVLLLSASLILAACGSAAGPTPTAMNPTATPESTPMGDMMGGEAEFDQAFIDMMVPHHQSAVEMARVALERAEHPEIQQMANDIIAAQAGEITQMHDWRQQWYGSSETPPMSEMPMLAGMPGMGDMPGTMDMAREVERLSTVPEPFDLAFIDAMIDHHQDAIDAAQLALEQANRQEIKDLAQDIIDAQQREIGQLRAWRESWYGDAATPVG